MKACTPNNPKRKNTTKVAQGQEQAVGGSPVGLGAVALAQGLGHVGVDAHTGTHGEGDHQVLNGKGQGYGREGLPR